MTVNLLSKTEMKSRIEAKVNSYLDDFAGNLLWAGQTMEVLINNKIVFEVPIICTLNENYYKVGTLFVDVDRTEIIQEISDSPNKIKENVKNLVEMK